MKKLKGSSIIALSLVLGCTSNSDETLGPSRAEIDAFLDRICNVAGSCCDEIGVPNPEGCKVTLGSNSSGYVPELGAACLSEITAGDGGGPCFRFGPYPDDPCFRMFSGRYGSVPPGGTCAEDVECTAPSGGTSKCLSSRCQWQLPGKAGDAPCVGQTSDGVTLYLGSDPQGFICDAADGLYCDASPTAHVCRPLGTPGERCFESSQCATGACSGSECLATAGLGESCAMSRCAPGGFCDFTTHVCTPPKPVGSACINADECTTDLCFKDSCSRFTFPQFFLADTLCKETL